MEKSKLDQWVFRGYFSEYDKKLRLLASEMTAETWNFDGQEEYSILRKYITYTFEKLRDEQKNITDDTKFEYIYECENCACFNTGLFDRNWQQIYFYCEPNEPGRDQKWRFQNFFNSYTITYKPIPANKLRRPNYFTNPADLIFNVNLSITPQWSHILDDSENFNRLPESIRILGKSTCQTIILGAIERIRQRAQANYKTIVPQWRKGKIQLLAPLFLTNEKVPDLALVMSLDDNGEKYIGHTCLTREMAYNNARLIARPDSDWLHP
ncbi:MAG: DUF3825 domain-containing protein [Oscillospiraceae bacterium]|nr:DUF3825 domain-containing protein [Oscillospiraceae bacterium]